MATEPMLAKLLICGIKKAYYVCSKHTAINITKNTNTCIGPLFAKQARHIGLQVQFHFNCSSEGKFACTISAYGFVRYNPGSKSSNNPPSCERPNDLDIFLPLS